MDKNSIIGFVLIGVIFFGFTWYQSNQYQKQREYQAQLDSAAYADQAAQMALQDSIARATGISTSDTAQPSSPQKYLDSLLNSRYNAEATYVTLANEKLELVLSTKGAQPYSARLNDYKAYDSTDLYLRLRRREHKYAGDSLRCGGDYRHYSGDAPSVPQRRLS